MHLPSRFVKIFLGSNRLGDLMPYVQLIKQDVAEPETLTPKPHDRDQRGSQLHGAMHGGQIL